MGVKGNSERTLLTARSDEIVDDFAALSKVDEVELGEGWVRT